MSLSKKRFVDFYIHIIRELRRFEFLLKLFCNAITYNPPRIPLHSTPFNLSLACSHLPCSYSEVPLFLHWITKFSYCKSFLSITLGCVWFNQRSVFSFFFFFFILWSENLSQSVVQKRKTSLMNLKEGFSWFLFLLYTEVY